MKILIANRGEIACRIIKTCKKLGIETVVIYTPDDKFNLYVKQGDYKIELPEGPFNKNYLNIDLIISKALELNVKAVHPGYGFLSEMAEACLKFEQAGIIWIGPTYQNISDMAQKNISKNIAEILNIPTSKYLIVKSIEDCLKAVEKISYPVMIKASGGGGGLGILKCENEHDLRKNFPQVEQTNKSLYNNSEIFIEKFISDAHHIEVQVVGDGKGHVITVGERECSIQRRNQKVVEETPSPYLNDQTRKRLFEDSIKLASYLKYKSVGTIEFLFDHTTNNYYFLEVNTRLQVEHPITERTFSIDLVEVMIKIAINDDFKIISERNLAQQGHSIEVRICAEDPLNKFTPSFGRITNVDFKKSDFIRVDTWIENDSFVSPLYDSLICKAISHGNTREEAIEHLVDWLENSTIQGVSTNIYFLASILRDESFRSGITLTKFLNTFTYESYSCNVIEGGMYSLIVDYPGRVNYLNVGIPPSGPIDSRNHRIANYLVGNQENDAAIEILLDCFALKFFCDSVIAVAGANCDVKIDDQIVNMFESVYVKSNSIVEIRLNSEFGCRTYLAIQGGIRTS
jgi:urea carboxylase